MHDGLPAVMGTVMGAHLPEGTDRTADTIRYSAGILAAVMAVWIEQPHQGWLVRELAQRAALSPTAVGRVMRDLVAAGHAKAAEPVRVRGSRFRLGAHVLTAEGIAAWRGVDLEVGRRYMPPHRVAKPCTPRP